MMIGLGIGLALSSDGVRAPWSPELLFASGEIGGASYLPDPAGVFTDTTGAMPAAFGESIARVSPSGGQAVPALQPSASLRPLLGQAPKDRRNLLVNTAILATQARAVTNAAHTLSFKGTGSIVRSGVSSGTLEGTGANDRVSVTFTPAAGNLTLTVSGSVTEAQLEVGSVLTPYQRVGAATDFTEEGVPSYPFIRFDLSDDRLDTVLPQAVTGDVVIAGRNGSVIAPHSYAANTTFQLGPTSYTGGTPGILRAIGDVVGWSILDKTLTPAERERLMRFYKRRGANGLLVPGGPELVVNGTFDTDLSGWTPSSANVTATRNASGQIKVTNNGAGLVSQTINTVAGKTYRAEVNWSQKQGGGRFNIGTMIGDFSLQRATNAGDYTGTSAPTFVASGATAVISIGDSSGGTNTVNIYDNISVRELRPEEEW